MASARAARAARARATTGPKPEGVGRAPRPARAARAPRPLPRSFYARPVLQVARACIGKLLVHETPEGLAIGRIVETEAYRGPQDRAAHSWKGRRTRRTEPMFGRAGHAYVFFLYGMHWNFNVVTGKVGEPHAVLVRAVEPVHGVDLMAARRAMAPERRELTNGPAKLTVALGIAGRHSGQDICKRGLYLADAPPMKTKRSERIGIDYAGSWADKPWRFFAAESDYVSRARPGRKA